MRTNRSSTGRRDGRCFTARVTTNELLEAMGRQSPVDTSVPRPPRDVQPTGTFSARTGGIGPSCSGSSRRSSRAAPVGAGRRWRDRRRPVLDQSWRSHDGPSPGADRCRYAAAPQRFRRRSNDSRRPATRRKFACLARRVVAAKPVVAVRRPADAYRSHPLPYATTSTEAVWLDHDDPQPPDPGRRAPQGDRVKAVALVDCRPVRLAERRRGKGHAVTAAPLRLIAQPAKWLPPVWTWARVSRLGWRSPA
jgi:hypothetical protein